MQTTPDEVRQSMGCGYEPPLMGSLAFAKQVHIPRGWKHDRPETCPGYTTKLPEVIETAYARLHWSKGALGVALRGEQPHEHLLDAIVLLEGASNECENLRMTPAAEGGLLT